MLHSLIAFCARRHYLTNALFVIVIVAGIVAWRSVNKEELPSVTFDRVRITTPYPGATAEDVEYFVTQPIEEKIRDLDGVHRVTSESRIGSSQVSVELDHDVDDIDAVVNEMRSEVLDVDLPDDIITDPRVRVFRTDKKAIIDIALFHAEQRVLDGPGRRELQDVVLALENQLLALPEVNTINRSGYLGQEIQVKVDPALLRRYEIPLNRVSREIRSNHLRRPAGTLEMEREPRVTLVSELETPERIAELPLQGGFEGQIVRVKDVATVTPGFAKSSGIQKVNGHEAVLLSVVKTPAAGILDALEAVSKTLEQFETNNLGRSPVTMTLLDDESFDLRNRLHIISVNGVIGFGLILVMLFIFLNWRSGLWVALGIPFTFCFTLAVAGLMGHTINGMTLAAVIIVMGIVVDDAIVVAENITRMMRSGVAHSVAVVEGTAYVLKPIVASIVTTCAAFVPLYFFEGRYGRLIAFIPPIVILMLVASLIESLCILPGHMSIRGPGADGRPRRPAAHWFERVERGYGRLLAGTLRFKWLVLIAFAAILFYAHGVMTHHMKYEMFPREETRDIVLFGETAPGSTKYETDEQVRQIEDLIAPALGDDLIGFRTRIASGRGGGSAQENRFRIAIEVAPRDQRERSANEIIALFESETQAFSGFEKLRFQKSRWGQSSGSPVEVIVHHNDDGLRGAAVSNLVLELEALPYLKSVEVDAPLRVPEYRIDLNREQIRRLAISSSDIASTMRTALEGSIVHEFTDGDTEVKVRVSSKDDAKDSIDKILQLPVENQRNYLVPLSNVVTVLKQEVASSISRENLKRTTRVYADIEDGSDRTPLDVAEELESAAFGRLLSAYPTIRLSFRGEIADTRESTRDFANAITLVIVLIYVILVILFESLWKPLVIMSAIPFGVAGVVLAFHAHGIDIYGFYSIIGLLGLAGVIVNDSIIMLVRLTDSPADTSADLNSRVAAAAQTRLRAVVLTTITTVAGVLPTAYGWAGYDAMLAEMMLALTWGLIFGTAITLVLIPCLYAARQQIAEGLRNRSTRHV